ncbi:hypothetical protein [Spiroplasma taiwanense]|uniref:DNA polymerase III subunit delta n=1 Tax=Spiroplasma taiwanense CT-1 TaxID=1276220 RepID=S5LYJ0_9MOLU|nr:hypothetical protein [Spiroplasma taiwanense]AGR40707.1 DNA polymerase III subunit delta' [Spiroplasma taiwanense CT-1]
MEKEKLFELLNNLISANKMYHSIIVVNTNQNLLEEISIEISRQIFCENKALSNDNCKWCIKSYNKNNLNIFFIGDGTNQISKVEIKDLIIKFSSSALENNINKIYIIKNAEQLNEFAANSLLKFLEEPPKNTYAILLSNDKNQILSTIKSRCKIFSIFSQKNNLDQLNDFFDLFLEKNKENLLLYLIELKQKEKFEIVQILENTFNKSINLLNSNIHEILLDALTEIKTSNHINLILENLFIKIHEVI